MLTSALRTACLAVVLSVCQSAFAQPGLEPAIVALKKGDAHTAVNYLRPLAKSGNAEAQFMLVSALQTIDRKEAAEWLIKAANNRHPSASHILGLMYRDGLEVAADPHLALQWLTVAAEGGILPAQLQLGMLYRNGPNAMQDDRLAAQWISRAARAGLADAQFQLADLYRYGYGVKQDSAETVAWLRRAATQGHEKAAQALAQLGR